MIYLPGKLSQLVDRIGYTNGGEYMFFNGEEYIGPYFVIDKKVIPGLPDMYKGKPIMNELIPFNPDENYIKYINILGEIPYYKNQSPKSYRPHPTEKDYERGWIYRYFCKKRNETEIIEIDEKQYKTMAVDEFAINPDLYTAIEIKWVISGSKYDKFETVKGVKIMSIPSVQRANANSVREAEKIFSGISQVLKDFTEFVRF